MSIRKTPRAAIALLVLATSQSAAAKGNPFGIDVPDVPATLAVPDGNRVFMKGHAEGTQNAVCLPSSGGVAWTFIGPQATLFHTFPNRARWQNATHFLSANPAANGLPQATWQHSIDTSRVWARAVASSSDPAHVEAGAVPWLLLQATGSAAGPTGGTLLARTTFIHRLTTSGGVAPSTGCSVPADVGKVALVPYSADYYFYRAGR